jgi:hypothetical protein
MPRHALGVGASGVLLLGLCVAGCGGTQAVSAKVPDPLQQCRHEWHDVAGTVVGLDQDSVPSALASRWTSVIATIAYYETTPTAKDCRQHVDAQVAAIDALRAFSERLRPYDMAYQLEQVSPAADLYAHEPLPAPYRGASGHQVKPPAKQAVAAAIATLAAGAATADADLQPGWEQLASVELTDAAAVRSALSDLDFLARDSAAWVRCKQALTVLEAAARAQEGGPVTPGPGSAPTSAPPAG